MIMSSVSRVTPLTPSWPYREMKKTRYIDIIMYFVNCFTLVVYFASLCVFFAFSIVFFLESGVTCDKRSIKSIDIIGSAVYGNQQSLAVTAGVTPSGFGVTGVTVNVGKCHGKSAAVTGCDARRDAKSDSKCSNYRFEVSDDFKNICEPR